MIEKSVGHLNKKQQQWVDLVAYLTPRMKLYLLYYTIKDWHQKGPPKWTNQKGLWEANFGKGKLRTSSSMTYAWPYFWAKKLLARVIYSILKSNPWFLADWMTLSKRQVLKSSTVWRVLFLIAFLNHDHEECIWGVVIIMDVSYFLSSLKWQKSVKRWKIVQFEVLNLSPTFSS